MLTIILYSRQIEVFSKLALRKQYHRILQEVLLNINDACLIDFLNQIADKIPPIDKETDKFNTCYRFRLYYIF